MLDEMLIGGELQEPSKKVRMLQCVPSQKIITGTCTYI